MILLIGISICKLSHTYMQFLYSIYDDADEITRLSSSSTSHLSLPSSTNMSFSDSESSSHPRDGGDYKFFRQISRDRNLSHSLFFELHCVVVAVVVVRWGAKFG